jgi:probable O-glycosylation ligase (exosortase A-associated)
MFRPQEWLWFDVSSLRLSVVIGGVLFLRSLASGLLPDFRHPLSIGALLFVLTGLFAQVDAADASTGWAYLGYFFRLVLICLLTVSIVDTEKKLFLFLAVLSGSFGFHSAKAGVMSVTSGGLRFSEGFAGSFTDNNGYALGCAMFLFLLVVVGQNVRERWAKLGFYLAGVLTAVTVVSTFSRGGFLALGCAALVFFGLQRRKLKVLLIAVPVGLLAVSFVRLPAGYLDRMQTIRTYEEVQEESALSRLHFWRVAVDMAVDRPFGVGLRNFDATYDRYDFLDGLYGRSMAVHSSHFQVLAETGFLGLFLYAALFVVAFRIAFRVRSRSRGNGPEASEFLFTVANGLIASMTAFLVGGAFIALALNDLTWLTFALVASADRISSAKAHAEVAAEAQPTMVGFGHAALSHPHHKASRTAAARS